MLGDRDTHDRLIRELATGAGVTVVFVDFTRSPEAQYPVAIEQGYAATRWVAEHGRETQSRPKPGRRSGDDTGGNLAAAIILLAKDRRGPPIAFQLLFYPVTDTDFETSTYQQFGIGGWLTRDAMKWFWSHISRRNRRGFGPQRRPLRASLDQLDGLPPALVITAENNVLRDEGEAYAQKLAMAGVEVTAVSYLGTIHDFIVLQSDREYACAPGGDRAGLRLSAEGARDRQRKAGAGDGGLARLTAAGSRRPGPRFQGVTAVTSKISSAGGAAPAGPGFLAAKT